MLQSQNFNEQSDKVILKILGSNNARKILKSISERSMSVSQISKDCNIPLTKTYRWIKKLQNLKFVRASGIISKEKRKVRSYQSLVKMIIFNANDVNDSKVQVLGIGNNFNCNKCGSGKCTLEYNTQTDLWNYNCLDCSQEYVQTNFIKLKEEQQKVILLEELNIEHVLKEEQQKVILLESLLHNGKVD
jgi:DNA-binding transcriptional ArsR family regulator